MNRDRKRAALALPGAPRTVVDAEEALRRQHAAWSGLRAWDGWRFDRARVVLSDSDVPAAGRVVRGRRDGDWKIVVFWRWNENWVDALATLLHEMAHVASASERVSHGPRWRAIFAAALAEVSGFPVEFFDRDEDLDVLAMVAATAFLEDP